MRLFFAMFLTLVLFSCSDDPLSESIVGTWELQSIESTGCDDPEDLIPLTEVDDDGCISLDGDKICNLFYTFEADGSAVQTLTEDGDTDTDDYTYTVNDDNDTILLCDSPTDCNTATVDGNEMTIIVVADGCTISVVCKKA